MKLTPKQQALFWAAFKPAWDEHCRQTGHDPADIDAREHWRHGIILQETGLPSLASVRPGAEIDRLLKRLAIEAGDYARAAHMEAAEAGRIRARCLDVMRQIAEIEGRPAGDPAALWPYIARLVARSYHGRAWLDIPEHELRKVFMMLDTHRRRLLRRAGWSGARLDPAKPLSYAPGRHYSRNGAAVSIAIEANEASK